MGGKASKSKSVDITTPPPTENVDDKVTKEGNGVADIASEEPLVKTEETAKDVSNETKEEDKLNTEEKEKENEKENEKEKDDKEKDKAVEKSKDDKKDKKEEKDKDKSKEKEKSKDKDKEKDKEKPKDKEKTEKKKEKKRSFSFLSKKQKKSKDGSNGDVEAKVSTEEPKNEIKEDVSTTVASNENAQSEPSAAVAGETIQPPEETQLEDKPNKEQDPIKDTTEDLKPENSAAGEASEKIEVHEPQLKKIEEVAVASVPEVTNSEETSKPTAVDSTTTVKSESKTEETTVAIVNEPAVQAVSVPDVDAAAAGDASQKQMETEEKPVVCTSDIPLEVTPVAIPVNTPPACSLNVEAEVQSPEQPADLPPTPEKHVEEVAVSSISEKNIPDIPSEVVDESSNAVDEVAEDPSSPVEPVCNEISSNDHHSDVDLSPVEADLPVDPNIDNQSAISSPVKDEPETQASEKDGLGSVSATVSDISNRSSMDDTVNPVIPAVDLQSEVESTAAADEHPAEQSCDESLSSPILLTEPTVVVQAATPEPLSDETAVPIVSLPSPPAMIEASSESSLESADKIPSPAPVNDSDFPVPAENCIHDGEVPSPDEIQDQPLLIKKTSLMNTKITWEHGGNEVSMTGSFMDWADSVQLIETDGIFSVAVDLPEGEHYCKFLVDGSWTTNSAQPIHELDGQGQVNVITVKVGNEE